ncbi:glycosyltransferase [Paenibacillus sp. PL91]|uniref:glycosyltransferase n=1 Tax=Paenibacillus sp. PL91 TaxID=2729538 RepID=UPI00145F3FCE|nr:glycosyltransferase [Paenibacillus sp. PL91]MBC9202005.1 glycosyltransferase [Paenibacillus sp. PL91]
MTSSPLSVLMALDSMDAGGTETHVLSLATALINSGQRVSLISSGGPLRPQFEEAGCSVFSFDFRATSSPPYADRLARLKDIIRSQKIDIVHVHQTPSGLFAAKAADQLAIPMILTAHGTYYPQVGMKSLLASAKAVISVSPPVQRYIEQLGFTSAIIPNGIDLTAFYPSKHSKLRSDLGIAEDAVVLVYASRLAWGKGSACDTLLRAMKDLHQYGWDRLQLIVVGDGPKYEAINALASFIQEESGRKFIHMLGKQSQMRECYNAADIVVGTGRVALEAMACEKPVLAVGNHGYYGWIEPDTYEQAWSHYFGDHGSYSRYSRYLFSSDIAHGCRRLEELRAWGREGRRWVEREFHIDRALEQTMNVYRSATGKSS